MRKLFTVLAAVVLTANVFAQAPQKMSYQAVIRNSSNALIPSTAVGMRISILQGSTTGTEVYKEIYNPNPQTNANGLVSIEIGGGIPVTGTFATIDWANGPYFIKTETDPTGGTNYTITGTSQLLSVPYALYAKTAESVTGGITETDPIFSASVAKQINAADTVKWNAKLSSYTETDPVFSASVAKGIKASDTTQWNASIHKIGDSYGGGIVFYVYDGGQHGLIVAPADQSTGIRWYAGTYTNTMAFADGVGAGKANTAIIIADQGYGDGATYPARVCNEYSVTVSGVTYGDWYLPSKFELNLLYLQKTAVGGFASALYWSSTEYDTNLAWVQAFDSGSHYYYNKFSYTTRVRAVRAF